MLRLTSDQDSRECAPGATADLQQVQVRLASAAQRAGASMVIGDAQDTCSGRADLAGIWVRLS